jgi:hypothetical protein
MIIGIDYDLGGMILETGIFYVSVFRPFSRVNCINVM